MPVKDLMVIIVQIDKILGNNRYLETSSIKNNNFL